MAPLLDACCPDGGRLFSVSAVERFSLLDGTRSELPEARERNDCAAKDFEPRRTCSVGDSSTLSKGSEFSPEFCGVVTIFSIQSRCRSKLGEKSSFIVAGKVMGPSQVRRERK